MPKRPMSGWAGRICLWIKARHGGEGTGQLCAVVRRRSSVGASPTRQLSLRPEAIGAVMEVAIARWRLGQGRIGERLGHMRCTDG